jgi:hypothetical protein
MVFMVQGVGVQVFRVTCRVDSILQTLFFLDVPGRDPEKALLILHRVREFFRVPCAILGQLGADLIRVDPGEEVGQLAVPMGNVLIACTLMVAIPDGILGKFNVEAVKVGNLHGDVQVLEVNLSVADRDSPGDGEPLGNHPLGRLAALYQRPGPGLSGRV